jgi:hypothetical protein
MKIVLHATYLKPWGGQRTITAVCGKRPSVNRVLSLIAFEDLPAERYTSRGSFVPCVGCRAILIELQRERERNARKVGL